MNFNEINTTENPVLMVLTTNETINYSKMSFQYVLWLISLISSIVLSIVGLWLVATIGFYGFTTGKFYSKKKSSHSECIMLRIIFSGTIFILPCLVTSNSFVWFGWGSSLSQDLGCEIVIDIYNVFYSLCFLHVFLFLWLRQRYLYLKPLLQRQYTVFIKTLSWICIVFIFLYGIAHIFLITIMPQNVQASSYGCVRIFNDKRSGNYVVTGIVVLAEFVLICLFVYPLYRHRSSHGTILFSKIESITSAKSKVFVSKSIAMSTASVPECNRYTMKSEHTYPSLAVLHHKDKSQPKTILNPSKVDKRAKNLTNIKTKNKIVGVMQRSVISACVCTISDVLVFAVVPYILPNSTVLSFRNVFYDINLIVNILSLVFTFGNYKKIFLALLIGKNSSSKRFS